MGIYTDIWITQLGVLAFWIFVLGLNFLFGAYRAYKARTPELQGLTRYYFGFFLFMTFVSVCGGIHFAYEFYLYKRGIEMWAGLLGNASYFYFLLVV